MAKEQPLPPMLLEIAIQCNSAEGLIEAALFPLSLDGVKGISDSTTLQSNSEFWFIVRTGRTAASILKQCAGKVDLETGTVRGETTSFVEQIMNYYAKAQSPAINWG